MTEACEYPENDLYVFVGIIVLRLYGMRNCQNDAQQGIESDSVNETDICG